mmetsp:Transcript_23419/g.48744  ORF Transcript_23419/g.48744 Transcript_23419/m.48744 type:complete len:246 (-) Transcript_23419:986-1723(-)
MTFLPLCFAPLASASVVITNPPPSTTAFLTELGTVGAITNEQAANVLFSNSLLKIWNTIDGVGLWGGSFSDGMVAALTHASCSCVIGGLAWRFDVVLDAGGASSRDGEGSCGALIFSSSFSSSLSSTSSSTPLIMPINTAAQLFPPCDKLSLALSLFLSLSLFFSTSLSVTLSFSFSGSFLLLFLPFPPPLPETFDSTAFSKLSVHLLLGFLFLLVVLGLSTPSIPCSSAAKSSSVTEIPVSWEM